MRSFIHLNFINQNDSDDDDNDENEDSNIERKKGSKRRRYDDEYIEKMHKKREWEKKRFFIFSVCFDHRMWSEKARFYPVYSLNIQL